MDWSIVGLILTNLFVAILLASTVYSALKRNVFKKQTNAGLWIGGLSLVFFALLSMVNRTF